MAMPVVYIAAPFTAPTGWGIEQNVRRAEEAGLAVAEMGASPLIPHANTRFFVGTKTPAWWYEATLALLLKCDAVLIVGAWEASKGATAEALAAQEAGIPVFELYGELALWIQRTVAA